MSGARRAWDGLERPWQLSLEEAWESWRSGCAGVGCVIVDEAGDVVATGRNRIADERREPGVLAGTFLAHAEMNALAVLRLGDYSRLTLYTTFEPCLMCASAIVVFRIPEVHFAAEDPVFVGLHDWFAELPFAADRLPRRDGPIAGPIGDFAHVLHLSWLSFWVPEGPVIDSHHTHATDRLELARHLNDDGCLGEVSRAGGTVVDALERIWDPLTALPTT